MQGSGNPTIVTFEFPTSILETIKHPRIYVKLDLLVMRGLSSKHSLALYEFLSDYFNLGAFRCSKDDFRLLMGISATQYPSFAMLRKRVLEVAVNEINEKTIMNVSFDLERVGKRIEAINFTMKQKEEVLDQHDPTTAIREKLKSFGLSESKITSLLEHHDE